MKLFNTLNHTFTTSIPILFFLLFSLLPFTSPMSTTTTPTFSPRPLPPQNTPLIIGYSHNPTGNKVIKAIQNGVNVLCWAFFHLDIDPTTLKPIIRTDRTKKELQAILSLREEKGKENLLHIAAIGGWNAPHPPPGISGEQYAQVFHDFNEENGFLFDGVDWDLEGHDDREGPTSFFTLEILDVMADMSVALKKRGYVVSMAPAESYLDALAKDSSFSLQLNLFPECWGEEEEEEEEERKIVVEQNFAHAGRQCYAYVIYKAGVETFDWVALQLYEGFSRFVYETTVVAKREGEGVVKAQMEGLRKRLVRMREGFEVDLPVYGEKKIKIPREKIVWGFANGWADGKKFVVVERGVFEGLRGSESEGRGVMFWTIEEEGNGGLYLARVIQEGMEGRKEHFEL